jgi:hypothetical protein
MGAFMGMIYTQRNNSRIASTKSGKIEFEKKIKFKKNMLEKKTSQYIQGWFFNLIVKSEIGIIKKNIFQNK